MAVRFRNFLFEMGLKKSHRADVPVISIGNITTGGTGKTPFSAFLCHWFLEKQKKPVFLSRGYRSLEEGANDEKLVLDQLCPGVPHIQDRDRVSSSKKAVWEFEAEILLLDDGFQHRRLKRDLDIVLIDALNPWGYGYVLPRGLLREPLNGLKRADLIVITRADQAEKTEIDSILLQLKSIRGNSDHIQVSYPPSQMISPDGKTESISLLEYRKVGAFCGIGNPEGFRKVLEQAGFQVEWFKAFPDHHHFTKEDLNGIEAEVKERGISSILTTQKDLVKIRESLTLPIHALQIETKILSGEELLFKKLEPLL